MKTIPEEDGQLKKQGARNNMEMGMGRENENAICAKSCTSRDNFGAHSYLIYE